MKAEYLLNDSLHRQVMTKYYRPQARLYDATRWMFLYGRLTLVEQIDVHPGDRVLEIGCGTGRNFDVIQRRLNGTGELIGVDCSSPMLARAEQRVRKNKWSNVHLVDLVYGKEPLTRGKADVVLFSYSLSMIADWQMALACAHSELWPGGRIGVVDFCRRADSSKWFTEWLAYNHVNTDVPYEEQLMRLFQKTRHARYDAWAGLWSFYVFVGARASFSSKTVSAGSRP